MGRQIQHHNGSRNFLPLLCRLSIKDVKLPRWSDDSSSSSSTEEDPSSPKVSCIGQVKKRNNKIVSCPMTAGTAPSKSADNNNNVKYTKLRKLFSGKNLLISGAATTIDHTSTTHHLSCKISRSTNKEMLMIRNSSTGMRLRRPVPPPRMSSGGGGDYRDESSSVNVEELDPPLPVVKKVQQPGGCEVNLWKRRCGGGGGGVDGNESIRLKSLQVQQIHVPNKHLHIHLPPTTV